MLADQFELSGSATGWGLNFSSNLKLGAKDVIRAAFVVGEGIQNSMNDSPIDIGIQNNLQNAVTPIVGKPLPMTALSLFVDHSWNAKFSSAVGYSRQDIDNSDGQAATAFKTGAVRARQPALHACAECDGRGRAAVGTPDEFLGRIQFRRAQVAVLVQVQLLGQVGG